MNARVAATAKALEERGIFGRVLRLVAIGEQQDGI
jgi:hypothetical protein